MTGKPHMQVTHRVMCSRTLGTATAYLIDLDNEGVGIIRAKEPVRHEANGSGGGATRPLTVARLRSQGAMDRTCAVCGNLEIAICKQCGTMSCATNGLPWTCPTCQDHHERLNMFKTTSFSVSARAGHAALDHERGDNPGLSTERRDQLPPSSIKRLPKRS